MTHEQPADKLTRREIIQRGLMGAALAMTPGLTAGVAGSVPQEGAGSAAAPSPRKAHAKSVIQIWMWGGPSHLDTFDPKPDAGQDYCGPLNEPIPTNVDGVRICQLLPLLATHADKYSIIRSMTHGNNGHETAAYLMQTGREPGRLVFPSIGAIVSLFKGYDHGYTGLIPPYIVLTQAQGRFNEAGFLGYKYKPFCTGGDPNRTPFAVNGIVAEGISDERQLARRDLMHNLDTLGREIPGDPRFQSFKEGEEAAYDLMFGEARKLFDLGQEPEEMRTAYGRNTFGQSCLMARRLVEAGVPYITINYGGWDTHKEHFQAMQRKLPELDKGMSTLLQDLYDRGLLESTIVWWGGEFGRGPKVDWGSPWNGGRNHFGNVFSVVLAGGGFKGGQVVGASNETGTEVAERPVYPPDLIGSMLDRLGIDPDAKLPNPRGLDVAVQPTAEEGVKVGGRLKEIML
jgi:hypothetical protein